MEISASCVTNCRTGSDLILASKCVCMAASSSYFQNFPFLSSKAQVGSSASGRWSCSQAGAYFFQGRLASIKCLQGQEFRESSSGWNDQRRVLASATKDSSRDVFMQTGSDDRQRSKRRLESPGSSQPTENIVAQRQEGEEKGPAILPPSEEGELLDTDSHSLMSEGGAIQENNEQTGLGSSAAIGTVTLGLGLLVALGGFIGAGVLYKEQLNEFLIKFSDFLEGYGPAGYGLFVLVYAGLELLAIPAIPLTMSAGLLFGAAVGTIIVSIAGTIAATGAFLIARYLARDRILELAKGNKKFLAIDKAIGEDGFRVVTLLRLSPLLPFSLGNYLYGLTSVELGPYVLGSWLGMLPGSWAYVSAGAIGRTFISKQESEPLFTGGPHQLWTIGLGLGVTVVAATYVTKVAKEALKDIED